MLTGLAASLLTNMLLTPWKLMTHVLLTRKLLLLWMTGGLLVDIRLAMIVGIGVGLGLAGSVPPPPGLLLGWMAVV